MLIVKVEMWPFGSEENAYEIGRLSAANISECNGVSSYEVRLSETVEQDERKPILEFQVHDHRRSDGAWPLIQKALNTAIG